MCFIFSLYHTIFVPLLSEWLNLESFVALDSALCNGAERVHFQEAVLLWSHTFQSNLLSRSLPLSMDVLKWAKKRDFCHPGVASLEGSNSFLRQVQSQQDRELLLAFGKIAKAFEVHRCLPQNVCPALDVLDSIPQLEILSISSCKTVEPMLAKVTAKSGDLVSLSLSTCTNLQDDALVDALRSMPSLQELRLDRCKSLSGGFIRALFIHCPKLANVNLQFVGNSSSGSIQRELLMFGLHFRDRLTQFSYDGFTDYSLYTFMWHQRRLTRLDLSFCSYVTDASLRWLGAACPLLTDLNVSYCGRITNVAIKQLVRTLPALEALSYMDVDKVTDDTLSTIATHCRGLKELHICESCVLSEAGLLTLASCTTLTKLTFNEIALGDSTLMSIVSQCTLLVELDLSEDNALTDFAVVFLAKTLRGLEKLHVSHCSLVSDLSLFALAEHCPRLADVSVGFCVLITDAGLTALVESCRLLSSLDINGCSLVTCASIGAIGTHCSSRLRFLNIRCSKQGGSFTLACVLREVARLRRLRQLVTSFELSHFEELLAERPDLCVSEFNSAN